MKRIILLIAIIQSAYSFCQDTIIYDNTDEFMKFHSGTKIIPKYLSEKDTIYFLFEYNKNQKCKECNVDINRMIKRPKSFIYYFRTFENYFLSTLDLIPDEQGKYFLSTLTLKKSFLSKNKDIILTYDEIIDYGPINILNTFASKKVFVIDKKEIKNRKIIARQVNFWSNMFQE